MGHHAGAHSAAEKARKWAVGAIGAGVCALIGLIAYSCIYYGYLQEHINSDTIQALSFMEHL